MQSAGVEGKETNGHVYLFLAFCHDVRVFGGPDSDALPVVLPHQGGDLKKKNNPKRQHCYYEIAQTLVISSTQLPVNTFCISRSSFCLTSMLIGIWGNFLKTSSSRAIRRSRPTLYCPDGDFKVLAFVFYSLNILVHWNLNSPALNVTSSFFLYGGKS